MRADTLLELAVAVLGMETMLVSLLDGNRKFILAASGFITPGMSLDPPAICHWSLVPSLHQMIVVEDTLKDARQAAAHYPDTSVIEHDMTSLAYYFVVARRCHCYGLVTMHPTLFLHGLIYAGN